MDSEDYKLLELILDKTKELMDNDISGFRSTIEDRYDDFLDEDEDGNEMSTVIRNRYLSIDWDPINNSWEPKKYNKLDRLTIVYYVGERNMSVRISRYSSKNFYVASGSKNKDLKKKFVNLFNRTENWQEKELPRREREEFVDATTKLFPDILDKLILEEEYDED